jgi:hypothetical protein
MVAVKKRHTGVLLLVLMHTGISGCANKTQPSQTPPPQQAFPAMASATKPTPSLFRTDGEEQAWHRFIQGGRYRMAQPADFRFSEQARREMGPELFERYTTEPVVHWWGGTGVIVVDTTRTDENRFGLIVFMEPDSTNKSNRKACPYMPVWLYKNKDLSRSGLEQASGYWFVIEYDDSAKRTGKDEQRFARKHPNRCG